MLVGEDRGRDEMRWDKIKTDQFRFDVLWRVRKFAWIEIRCDDIMVFAGGSN